MLRDGHTARQIAIALLIAIGLIALPVLSVVLLLSSQQADLQRRSAIEVDNLIAMISEGMRQPIWNLDPESGAAIVDNVETDLRFSSLHVTSVAQGEFLSYSRTNAAAADPIERVVPVIHAGQQIGTVRAGIDPDQLIVPAKADWFPFVLVIVLQLLFSVGAVSLLLWYAARATREQTLAIANREIEAFRGLMQATIDTAPVAIAIRDREFRFVFANRTALEKFGLKREEIIGRTSVEALGYSLESGYLDYLESVDQKILETGEGIPLTPYSGSGDGVWSEFLASKTPIRDKSGVISHIVTVSVDVTELKRAEEAAIAAKEEAELANRAKSEFLANMSHELRTPLNAIIGFSEVMMNETFGTLENVRYLDYVRDIHDSGDHLHTIITDLLDIARVEVGAIELNIEDTDLGPVIDSACKMVERKAERAGVTLRDRTRRPLPMVRGDVIRLRQIFINLFDNAIKFTDAGGYIEIAATPLDAGRLAVTVSDSGVGIAASDLDRIVEPFVCAQSSATRNVSGTGLGLSLVKSLTELHGGVVELASELGQGTEVTIILPRAEMQPVQVTERRIA